MRKFEIPKNLEETYSFIDELEIDGKDEWLKLNDETSITSAHMGLGMWIRNNFELWEDDSKLKNWFSDNYFIDHPDDISTIIILYYHQKKNGNKINLTKTLNDFFEHWSQWEPNYKNKIRKFKLRKIKNINE